MWRSLPEHEFEGRAEMPTADELRAQARRAHRLARATSDREAAKGLERYAEELEARADALEGAKDRAKEE
jgi:hypothetical protein